MIKFEELYKTEYTLKFVNALRQTWQENDIWSSIGNPKELHLFLLIENGKIEYTLKNGSKLYAKSGDLVYIPAGCEYITNFTLDSNNIISSLGVNFKLFSENGEYLTDNNLFVFNGLNVKNIMYEIERLTYTFNQTKNKYNTELYKIFNILSDEYYKLEMQSEDFALIKNGVEYLHETYTKNYEISKLANLCGLSEVYFRRLFKKIMGLTPTEYRNKLRLEKACDYLKYTTIPIQLIAENLGFTDSAYFIKCYKQTYNVTPLYYRKNK